MAPTNKTLTDDNDFPEIENGSKATKSPQFGPASDIDANVRIVTLSYASVAAGAIVPKEKENTAPAEAKSSASAATPEPQPSTSTTEITVTYEAPPLPVALLLQDMRELRKEMDDFKTGITATLLRNKTITADIKDMTRKMDMIANNNMRCETTGQRLHINPRQHEARIASMRKNVKKLTHLQKEERLLVRERFDIITERLQDLDEQVQLKKWEFVEVLTLPADAFKQTDAPEDDQKK